MDPGRCSCSNRNHPLSTFVLSKVRALFVPIKFSMFLLFSPTLSEAQVSQVDNDFSGGGGVRIGSAAGTCDGTISGALRYNSGTIEVCNGSSWLATLTSAVDVVINNGNSFSAPLIIGTNDSNTLSFETNNSTHMTIDTTGKVGIGTTSPSKTLHVVGDLSASAIQSYNASSGANITAMGSNLDAYNYSYFNLANTSNSNQWSLNYRNGTTVGADAEKLMFNYFDGATYSDFLTLTSTGLIGVGTTNPVSALEVSGDVKIGNTTDSCDASKEGSVRYNSTTKTMDFCDGSSWKSIHGDLGYYGSLKMSGKSNCSWLSANTSWTTLNSNDTDCNSATVDGNASIPSEGKIPAIKFSNLAKGRYKVTFNAQFQDWTANAVGCYFRLTDGSVSDGYVFTVADYAWAFYYLVATFEYTSDQTNHTFYVETRRWNSPTGGGGCMVGVDDTDFDLSIVVEKIQ